MGTQLHQPAEAKARESVKSSVAESSIESRNTAAFDAWAQVYDTQANPLLVLEERFLRRLLPDIDGKDILDIGCGTGRWLEHLLRRLLFALGGVVRGAH